MTHQPDDAARRAETRARAFWAFVLPLLLLMALAADGLLTWGMP